MAVTAIVVAAAVLPAGALAAFPYRPGPDPRDYGSYRLGPGEAPNDLGGKLEWMYAATPEGGIPDPRPHELGGVRGGHVVDRDPAVRTAWMTTTGRPDVTIAVLDSGIRWNDYSAMRDVRKKTRLSDGELPTPRADRSVSIEPGEDCSDYRGGVNDANRDGVFNVVDYSCDQRVDPDPARGVGPDYPPGDPNAGEPVLDPQDVLIAFTDEDDDDDNGFRDDVVGWDFLDDDNDPFDDVQYGHGTGEARDSAAEADNKQTLPRPGEPSETDDFGDELGTCPNCMEIHMRVGDSFVADVNRFAQATVYAADNDVEVVQEALGTLNRSTLGLEAVEYAYRHGVTVVASAADEAAQHHNWPSSYPHVVLVNSVTKYNAAFTPASRSYLQFNGCTNFSSKVTLAIPSVSCSSDATGRGSGMAALVYSAALNALEDGRLDPHPTCRRTDGARCAISANEVRQVMASGRIDAVGQSDDVEFTDSELRCEPVPTPPCTDPNQNAQTTSRDAYTTSPLATTKSYPARDGHDQFYGWGRVNMRRGVEALVPPDDADAPALLPPEVEITAPQWFDQIDPDRSSFVVRGELNARGRDYSCRVLVAPGSYPHNGEAPDGDFEEVPSAACDGSTRSEPVDGVLAEVSIAELKTRFPAATVGDFKGREPGNGEQTANGRPNTEPYGFVVKVVAETEQGGTALTGEDRRNMFLHRDRDLLDGFPRQLAGDGESSPLLVDLDGDNRNELVVANSDGVVHAFERDGSEVPGWPVRGDRLPLHDGGRAFRSGDVSDDAAGAFLASVAAADIDRDGAPEVVGADLEGKVYAWSAGGERLFKRESEIRWSGKPLEPFQNVRMGKRNRTQHGFLGSPVLADVDGDDGGRLEIVAAAMDRHVYAWDHDGGRVDGFPLLVVDRAKLGSIDATTHAVRFDEAKAGPALDQGAIIDTPAVGDVDGDDRPDIVVGTNEEYRANTGNEGEFNASRFRNGPFSVLTDPRLPDEARPFNAGNGRAYVLRPEGDRDGDGDPTTGPDPYLPGWPAKIGILLTQVLPVVGEGITGSPVIGEVSCVDGGEGPKVGVVPAAGPAYLMNPAGRSCYGREGGRDITLQNDFAASPRKFDTPTVPAFGHPAFASLGGPPSFLTPVTGLIRALDVAVPEYQGGQDFIGGWDATTGEFRPGFPSPVNDLQFLTGPAVGDVDGLPGEEIVAGSAHNDLAALNAAGALAGPAWPKTTSDWTVSVPLLGSFGVLETDPDARKNIVHLTRSGTMFAYRTDAPACSPQSWPRFHHDNASSGDARRDAISPGRPEARLEGRTLVITAPGDDLLCGRAARYEVVTSDEPIGGGDFGSAEPLDGAPEPGEPGSEQRFELPFARRYVAVRAVDERGDDGHDNVGRRAQVDIGPGGLPPLAGAPPGAGGPRCLRRSARLGRTGVAGVRLGLSARGAIRRAGRPSSRTRHALRWCVTGGGRVTAGLARGRVAIVSSTAPGHRARGIRRGSSVRSLRRAYRGARAVLPGVMRDRRTRKLFGVRRGRVRFVAVADRRRALFRAYLRLQLRRSPP